MKTESPSEVRPSVMDGRRALGVHWVNYDRTERLSLGESPVTHWRIDSIRLSSPPPLSLTVFHWRRSILLWPFSNFALALHPALLIPSTHTHTHTHTHLLSRSFIPSQTSHHCCYYHCVSLSLFVVTRSFHPHAFFTVCSPSDTSVSHSVHHFLSLPLTRLVAWQSVCVPLSGLTIRY